MSVEDVAQKMLMGIPSELREQLIAERSIIKFFEKLKHFYLHTIHPDKKDGVVKPSNGAFTEVTDCFNYLIKTPVSRLKKISSEGDTATIEYKQLERRYLDLQAQYEALQKENQGLDKGVIEAAERMDTLIDDADRLQVQVGSLQAKIAEQQGHIRDHQNTVSTQSAKINGYESFVGLVARFLSSLSSSEPVVLDRSALGSIRDSARDVIGRHGLNSATNQVIDGMSSLSGVSDDDNFVRHVRHVEKFLGASSRIPSYKHDVVRRIAAGYHEIIDAYRR